MLSLLVPDSEATTCTPQGGPAPRPPARRSASPIGAGERQPDRVGLGDLERLEHDLVDAVVLEVDGLGKDLVASAGVDRQPERELARRRPVWCTRAMNRGLSPWVSELGTLRSTKKFLRTVSDAVVWPASVSAPVTPRAVIR